MYFQSDEETTSMSNESDNDTISLSNSTTSTSDNENITSSSEDDPIIIEFDEYSDDEEDDNIINEIYSREQLFLDSEKQDGQYYIGLSKHMKYQNILLLVNAISAKSFYKYSYIHVLKYLYYYSLIRLYQPNIEIMKVYILNDGTYSVILKTHWIRLIQRHWKKTMKNRKQLMKKQMLVSSLYHREIYGKFPIGLNTIPMLTGLMSQYVIY
jgi:hypothetical protein